MTAVSEVVKEGGDALGAGLCGVPATIKINVPAHPAQVRLFCSQADRAGPCESLHRGTLPGHCPPSTDHTPLRS